MQLEEKELGLRYLSFCDPRLNFEQSLGELIPLRYQFRLTVLGRSGFPRFKLHAASP